MTTSVSSTSSSDPTGAGALASSIPSNMNISQTGFLQLITAQLQNQNPLQPTDGTQFLSQLEGLSEVSSLQNIQGSMTANVQNTALTNGASMLGRSVLVSGSSAALTDGGSISGAAQAPTGASSLTVTVTDSAGNAVDAFSVPPATDGGLTSFSWNGATASGGTAPAGQYSFTINAMVSGASQSVSPMIASQVQSVTIDPTTQALDLNTTNGTVALSSVSQIY